LRTKGGLFVISQSAAVHVALDQWAAARRFTIERHGVEARIVIPANLYVGHEDHFGQVTRLFFEYLQAPATLPAWEQSNMLVKYFISTRGVEIASAH
jgi:hypothetical protein